MFRLACDNDAHWYVIPIERGEEWAAFCEISGLDERAWDVPTWAVRVCGSPTLIKFPSFEMR